MTQSIEEVIEGLADIAAQKDHISYQLSPARIAVINAAITALEGMVWREIEECPDDGEFVIMTSGGHVMSGARVNGGDFYTYYTSEVCDHMSGQTVGPAIACIIEPEFYRPLSALPLPKDKA